MRRTLLKPRTTWLIAAVLLALLFLLATLQYRWIGQVSEADRTRTADRLQEAAERFAHDFDAELSRLLFFFAPHTGLYLIPGDARFEERYARWRDEAPYPDLLRGIFLASRTADGQFFLTELDPAGERQVLPHWPEALRSLAPQLAEHPPRTPRDPEAETPGPVPFAGDIPALVLPFFHFPEQRLQAQRPTVRMRRQGRTSRSHFVILWIDEAVLTSKILPDLAMRHFARRGTLEYAISIVHRDTPEQAVYTAGPALGENAAAKGDARAALFHLAPLEALRGLGFRETPPPRRPGGEAAPRRGRRFGGRLGLQPLYTLASRSDGAWRLVVTHPAGSLEASVAAVRRRNLLISLGILGLLAGSVVLLVALTRQAQDLARRQIELVAGVSHELLTPLAAVRSAGQNLSDGVVIEPERVRRYGALVEREGRRLSDMVSQVLAFAGMEAERQAFHLAPCPLQPILEAALEDNRAGLEAAGIHVERELDPTLPAVMADREALRRAFQNLIGNAVKYAATGRWLGLKARPAGTEVEITVADRGRGIAAEDLPHVFEPFYRGGTVTASAVPGSGLGLSLVARIIEGHGGRVTVDSQPGAGSTFTLFLPTAAPGAAS